jgi:hypothetical protein
MKKIITRFGEIEYDPANTILFPEGLIGFENLRDFIVMPNRKEGPLFWIPHQFFPRLPGPTRCPRMSKAWHPARRRMLCPGRGDGPAGP